MTGHTWVNYQDLVIPPTVEAKIRDLQLRVKDIVYTFNQPMQERHFPHEHKYRRLRWFGAYWTGLYCKWDEYRQQWVILTCWRDDVVSIS
jgi:hypothetical protein